jgi:hypothetical protein
MGKPQSEDLDPLRDENQATLHAAYLRTVGLNEALDRGEVNVPPCTINGEPVIIFEIEQGSKRWLVCLNRMLETVIRLLTEGCRNIIIEVPDITATVIGNVIMEDRFYYIEIIWRDILAKYLSAEILKESGIMVLCSVSLTGSEKSPIIHCEMQIPRGIDE